MNEVKLMNMFNNLESRIEQAKDIPNATYACGDPIITEEEQKDWANFIDTILDQIHEIKCEIFDR